MTIALCAIVIPFSSLAGQSTEVHTPNYDEFYAAWGAPGFAEQPYVTGTRVLWRKKNSDRPIDDSGVIQCLDASFLPGVSHHPSELREYPWNQMGFSVSERHLFVGSSGGSPRPGEPVVARELISGCGANPSETLVSAIGRVVAANRDHVFLRVDEWEIHAEPYRNHIYAKPLEHLAEPSPEHLIEIAHLRRPTAISRSEAASDRYFVWQDKEPDSREASWQIYVMDLARGIDRDAVRVIETHMAHANAGPANDGVQLDLSGSYLVYVAAAAPVVGAPRGIAFVDLDRPGAEPELVDHSVDVDVLHRWPAVSQEYVVWNVSTRFFHREAWAMRIEGGWPNAELMNIGPGGSWIEIDRNLAVMNGVTDPRSGLGVQEAIVVRELPLPRACDLGDVDHDGALRVTDAVIILRHLFLGGPRPRLRLADVDTDGRMTIGDAVGILGELFLGGPSFRDCP